MDYINQLKLNSKLYLKEVERLEKENEKTRTQLHKTAGEAGGHKYWKDFYKEKSTNLEKENARLKAQIEDLNEMCNELKDNVKNANVNALFYRNQLDEARKEVKDILHKNQLALNILKS